MLKSLLILTLCHAAFGAKLNDILRPRYRRSDAAFHGPWYGTTDYTDFDDFHKHGSYQNDGSYHDYGQHHNYGFHHGHGYGNGFPNNGYDYHGFDHGPWKNGQKHDHRQCTTKIGSPNFNGKTPWNSRTPATTTTEDPLKAARLMIAICMRSCPVTTEYNPVCGTNDLTYSNLGRLECAKNCGVDVSLKKPTSCDNNLPLPTTTEVLSTSTRQPTSQIKITTQTPEPFNPTRYTTIDVSSIDFDSQSTMGIPAPTDKVININTILPNSDIKPTRFTTVDVPKMSTSEPSLSTLGNEQVFTTDMTDNAQTRPTARPAFTVPANVLADIFTTSPDFETTLDEGIDFDVRHKEEGGIVFPDDR